MNEYSIRDIYLTLRRYLRLIVALPVAFGIVAAIVLVALPKSYSASALVQMDGLPTGDPKNPTVNMLPVQVEGLALSAEVLASAVGDGQRARTQDFKVVTVASPSTLVVNLTAKGDSSARAAGVANAWAKATVQAANDANSQAIRVKLSSFLDALAKAQSAYQAARASLQAFTATSTLVLDQSTVQANLRELGRLGPGLAAAQEDAAVAATGVDVGITATEARARIATIQARMKALSAQTQVAQQRIATLQPQSQRLQDDLKSAGELIAQTTDNVNTLNTQLIAASRAARVFVPASPPESPDSAGAGLKVLVAVLVGLIVACTLPFLIEALREPAGRSRPAV